MRQRSKSPTKVAGDAPDLAGNTFPRSWALDTISHTLVLALVTCHLFANFFFLFCFDETDPHVTQAGLELSMWPRLVSNSPSLYPQLFKC